MPNITMYLDAEAMPSEHALDSLTAQCTEACTGTLRAALDKVMALLMQQLDDLITKHTGHIARIRCFSFDKQHIHARN